MACRVEPYGARSLSFADDHAGHMDTVEFGHTVFCDATRQA
jgi:hypothetical protein